MEGMFWLLMLCGLTVGILLTLALCRRMLSQDLPEDAIQQIVQGVKAKLSAGKLSDTVDPLKNSFDKRDASPKWGARPFLRVR